MSARAPFEADDDRRRRPTIFVSHKNYNLHSSPFFALSKSLFIAIFVGRKSDLCVAIASGPSGRIEDKLGEEERRVAPNSRGFCQAIAVAIGDEGAIGRRRRFRRAKHVETRAEFSVERSLCGVRRRGGIVADRRLHNREPSGLRTRVLRLRVELRHDDGRRLDLKTSARTFERASGARRSPPRVSCVHRRRHKLQIARFRSRRRFRPLFYPLEVAR